MKAFRYGGSLVGFSVLSALAAILAGCNKRVEAVFERPPAVASTPEPKETDPATEETAAKLPEPPPEVEVEPEPAKPSPPPVRRRQTPEPDPAPPPPPPDPPTPRLDPGSMNEETRAIRETLARAEFVLTSLERRALTTKQKEQTADARAFVFQARRALDEGDARRARVLADKALILAKDVEGSWI